MRFPQPARSATGPQQPPARRHPIPALLLRLFRPLFLPLLLPLLLAAPGTAMAQDEPPSGRFPPEVQAALDRAQLPREALAVVVQALPAGGPLPPPRLSWQESRAMNPASLMKLLTTQAALELLGPAWRWQTPVWLTGPVRPDGVLDGDLVIQGQGDPSLVLERTWLLLRQLQQRGVRDIGGDIVFDRRAFPDPPADPAAFDGEALRPYNVGPDALLFNHKALQLSLRPEPGQRVARVSVEPPLAGVRVERTVPLSLEACGDWRAGLALDFSDPLQLRLNGSYPLACGEKQWPLAYPDPQRYNERLLVSLWDSLGGRLAGRVREGQAPSSPPQWTVESPPLAEVVRDINKFSNNLMAQQLFLSLALTQRGQGTVVAARALLQQWALERFGPAAQGLVVDNGSGLSRQTRLSAQLLARLLQAAWAGPTMPELMASLPVSGLDGTLRRSKAPLGMAHLKTGSLRDVSGVAGYVLAADGRRYVVVALVNHGNAGASRPVFDALLQWVVQPGGSAGSR